MRCIGALLAATAVLVHPSTAALAALPEPDGYSPVVYAAPADAPVLDTFRPPTSRYGRGNRGIDYATRPGQPARAAAAGTVVFSGRVGRDLHVVLLHADRIRTSYSFLAAVEVRRGARVAAGQPLGRAGARLHFGARAGDAYVDPAVLLGRGDGRARAGGRARLVPGAPPPVARAGGAGIGAG